MSGPSGESCGFCYYCVDPGALDGGFRGICGICVLTPLRVVQDDEMEGNTKPHVSAYDWCASFKLHPKMQQIMFRMVRSKGVVWWDDEVPKP